MHVHPPTPWRDRVFLEIDLELEKLGWGQDEARAYVAFMFNGLTSRHQLDDHQLRNLLHRLEWAAANQVDHQKQ